MKEVGNMMEIPEVLTIARQVAGSCLEIDAQGIHILLREGVRVLFSAGGCRNKHEMGV